MRTVNALFLLLPLCFVLGGCGGSGAAQGRRTVAETGIIQHIPLEGGFYGIVSDGGKNYEPINLSPEFRQDGLRVRFEARMRDDLAGSHMWGKMVELDTIERL